MDSIVAELQIRLQSLASFVEQECVNLVSPSQA